MLALLQSTFPDIVVVCICVKFKQDGERAKNCIYKSSKKKKKKSNVLNAVQKKINKSHLQSRNRNVLHAWSVCDMV